MVRVSVNGFVHQRVSNFPWNIEAYAQRLKSRSRAKFKNILLRILMDALTVKRSEEHTIKSLKGWLLVYGRRKTGKTFLLRRVFHESNYFVLTRSGYFLFESHGAFSPFNVGEAVRLVGSLLDKG